MTSRLFMRLLALMLSLATACALSACSSSDGTTTGPGIDPGGVDNGSNDVPPLVIDGPTQYPGKQDPPLPDTGNNQVIPGTFDFGEHIFRVPVDSQGTGRVTVSSFSPGQKVAFVLLNANPQFLDSKASPSGEFPAIPSSSYTVTAERVQKGGAAALEQVDLGGPYSGMDYTGQQQHPFAIYSREAEAQGLVPFAQQPGSKTTSAIQRGETRTFTNVEPRDISLPTIEPGEEFPDRNTDEFFWPNEYNSQDGRLVAVGQHCLIFLSTEINNGHPDQIRFTQSRLNRMANEFDTVIFPIATTSFGPVKSYGEGSVLRDVDRNIAPLTGDDFNADGELQIELPGEPDTDLIEEQKILIFLFNGAEGGFFTFGPAVDEEDRDRLVGSTLYIGTDNFPANDSDFNAAFSVMAHEFQHKLYADNGLPVRNTSYGWFNEGLSMLSMHLCGYTANSGKIINWAIDSQVVEFLRNVNQAAVPYDANPVFSNQAQYGSGFLFFLYMYEHYDPGVGKRIYKASALGERDPIRLVQAGALSTSVLPGLDGTIGTADDTSVTTQDTFEQVYTKFAIANFVDGIYAANTDLFDDRFHYNTINLRGTVNLSSGSIQLPGVRVGVFPENGTYPVTAIDRGVIPWGSDYLVFGNGDGQNYDFLFNADRNFKIYMLPVDVPRDPDTGLPLNANSVSVSAGAVLPY